MNRKDMILNALRKALLEFDVSVILEIAINNEGGWSNGCEILNSLDYEETKKYLKILDENLMRSW